MRLGFSHGQRVLVEPPIGIEVIGERREVRWIAVDRVDGRDDSGALRNESIKVW